MPAPIATPSLHYLPSALGTVAVAGAVIGADVWAVRSGRPTISRSFADALEHPVAALPAVALVAIAAWHLVVDPIIRRLEHRP